MAMTNNRVLASTKSRLLVLMLCLYGGIFGLHRFYVKKNSSAVLYLLTGGLFTIGVIYDFILIISGRFTDCYYHPVSCWDGYRQINPMDPKQPFCPRCNNDTFAYKTIHAIEKILEMKKSTKVADDAKRIQNIMEFKKTLANSEGEGKIVFCLNCGLIV